MQLGGWAQLLLTPMCARAILFDTGLQAQVEKLVRIIREVRAVSVRSESSPECGLRSGLTENAVPKQSPSSPGAVRKKSKNP